MKVHVIQDEGKNINGVPYSLANDSVDYEEMWCMLYERIRLQYPHVAGLMEEMDSSLLEEEE